MVSSASNSANSKDFADWNVLLLKLIDLNDFISTYYSNNSWLRITTTEGALLNA